MWRTYHHWQHLDLAYSLRVWLTFSDIPGHTTQEDLARVRGVLVDLRGQLTTPGTRSLAQRCNRNITLASHERHSVSDQRHYDCLFNSLTGLQQRNSKAPHFFMCGEPGWWVDPSQRVIYAESVSISWRLHDADSGGRLNKKDSLTRYGDSHVKDKTS